MFPYIVEPLIIESQNQAKNISVVLQVEAQSGSYTALLISRSWAEPSVEYTLLNTLREKK